MPLTEFLETFSLFALPVRKLKTESVTQLYSPHDILAWALFFLALFFLNVFIIGDLVKLSKGGYYIIKNKQINK